VLARTVARQLGLPCRRLLERSGRPAAQTAQTGQSRADRLSGPAFRARPGLDGTRVLVIDDVVTTGATLRAARRALRDAGAGAVVMAAVASTPPSSGATVHALRPAATSTAA
jgi:predicted amidophosphoribosyltransferase